MSFSENMLWWDELEWIVKEEILKAAQVEWTHLPDGLEETPGLEGKRQWISDQLGLLQFTQETEVSTLELLNEQQRLLRVPEEQTQGRESTTSGTVTVTFLSSCFRTLLQLNPLLKRINITRLRNLRYGKPPQNKKKKS